jgi:cytochrome subunit of sulfide dehydrogenase
MIRKLFIAAALAGMAAALPARAQDTDPNLARNLAATCANCHNTIGKSLTGMPPIAGQPRELLMKTLKEFKEGKRAATVMHQLTKGYTDGQLELIAAYFAAQK